LLTTAPDTVKVWPTAKPVVALIVKVPVVEATVIATAATARGAAAAKVADVILWPIWNGADGVPDVVSVVTPASVLEKAPDTPVTENVTVPLVVLENLLVVVAVTWYVFAPELQTPEGAVVQLRMVVVNAVPSVPPMTLPTWNAPLPAPVVSRADSTTAAVTATSAAVPARVPVMVPTTAPPVCVGVMEQLVVHEGEVTLIVVPVVGRPEVAAVSA